MTTPIRAVLLIGVPVAFAGVLWLHPMIGDYEGLRDVTTRFQVVHVAMVLALPLLAAGTYILLERLSGRAAAVARLALFPFVVFYVPYVAFEGVALGALGQELNSLPAAQRDAVAPGLVEDFARSPILGEPGVFWALGSIAWIVVIVATVLASVLIVAHTPPLATVGWLCFAVAGWMVLRVRHAAGTAPSPPSVPAAA